MSPLPIPPWGDPRPFHFFAFFPFFYSSLVLTCRIVYFDNIFHYSIFLSSKLIILLTPRLPDWPARGKRCVVGLIRKPALCIFVFFFINYFISYNKINPYLIPRLRSTWIERGSWRVFFLTRTHILKFTKIDKTPVCMLCTWLRFIQSVKLHQKHLSD